MKRVILPCIALLSLVLLIAACGGDGDGGGNGGTSDRSDREEVTALVTRQGELISREEWRDLWGTLTPFTRERCPYGDFLSAIQLDRILLGDLGSYRTLWPQRGMRM